MLNEIILWTVLIAPWFTLFLAKKEKIKRFMPAALLASYIMIIYNVIAKNQNHWEVMSLVPWLKPLFVSGVFGIFPMIAFWVFYFTYGRFWVYLATNVVIDFMFAIFPVHYFFHDILHIYELINITPWERWIMFVLFSVVIYGCYRWQEEIFKTVATEE